MQKFERVGESSVTTKGQVTIPVEIRRRLGVRPRDKVAWVVEDGKVSVTRSASVTERTAGIFKSHERPLSAEELRAAAEEAIAEDAVRRMGG